MRNRDWIPLAAAAWLVGLSALICDHLQCSQLLILGIRTLFAATTSAAIGLVMLKARVPAGMPKTQLYQFTRLVSRWVYILMYALAIMRVLIYLYEATVSFPRPIEDFQLYVTCCLVPLWLIRILVLAIPCKPSTLTRYAPWSRAVRPLSPGILTHPEIAGGHAASRLSQPRRR